MKKRNALFKNKEIIDPYLNVCLKNYQNIDFRTFTYSEIFIFLYLFCSPEFVAGISIFRMEIFKLIFGPKNRHKYIFWTKNCISRLFFDKKAQKKLTIFLNSLSLNFWIHSFKKDGVKFKISIRKKKKNSTIKTIERRH